MFLSVSDIRQKGITAESEGRYVAAIILLEQCLRADCLDSYGWLVLADAYRQIGYHTDCARALESALENAPETACWIVYIRYAMLATAQGQFGAAERFFETAAEHEGAQLFRWPLTLRAANLLQMEHFENAERFLRLALTIDDDGDDLDEVFHNLGLALMGQRKYQEAREALEQAEKLNPESKPTQVALKSLDGLSEAIVLAEELRMRNS
jgi:tetratricopeptide (TPR) repeat protein